MLGHCSTPSIFYHTWSPKSLFLIAIIKIMSSPIDFTLFDWKEIFGTVKATDHLMRPQTRGLRTEIQEIATAKHSAGQFVYIGMQENGRDYKDVNSNYWEDKGMRGMFKGKRKTSSFVLKNFYGNSKTQLEKTFDYILLKDTSSMSVAWATWDDVYKNIEVKSASVNSFVDYFDIKMIASNVEPKEKGNFSLILESLIQELV